MAAGAATVILLAGLSVRQVTGGAFAKYAGDALYAMLVYAVLVCVWPRTRPWVVGAVAAGFCWSVEFFQLTPWPAEWSAGRPLVRLALGSTFNAPDLAWYAVGVGLLAAVHRVARIRATH